jgi:hypothetical protein
MTAILSIDTVAMRLLAERIRAAAQSGFGLGDRRAFQPAITALAAPCLAHAVVTFLERWGATVADLVDDAHRLADAIDLTARAYQDTESVIEREILR